MSENYMQPFEHEIYWGQTPRGRAKRTTKCGVCGKFFVVPRGVHIMYSTSKSSGGFRICYCPQCKKVVEPGIKRLLKEMIDCIELAKSTANTNSK